MLPREVKSWFTTCGLWPWVVCQHLAGGLEMNCVPTAISFLWGSLGCMCAHTLKAMIYTWHGVEAIVTRPATIYIHIPVLSSRRHILPSVFILNTLDTCLYIAWAYATFVISLNHVCVLQPLWGNLTICKYVRPASEMDSNIGEII